MVGPGFLLLVLAVLLPLVVILLVVVVLVLGLTSRPDAEIGAATAAARRHAVTGGVLAVVAAVSAIACWGAVVVRSADGRLGGQLLALLFLVAATVHTAVLALTEVTWPRPTGLHRSGLLVRRGIRDVAPRPLLVVAGAVATATVLACVIGSVTADASGRSVSLVMPGGTSTTGPFPGAFYAAPVLVGVAVLAVLVALTLRLVVTRPAVAGAHPDADAALRRASAHRVLRGAAAGLGLTLAGLVATAGSAVQRLAEPAKYDAGGLALLILAFVIGLASLVLLLVPAARVPAPRIGAAPVPA